jgi:DNA-binding MarR family transcriptional regulator
MIHHVHGDVSSVGDMAANPPIVGNAGYLLYKAGVFGQRAFGDAFAEVGLTAREFLVLTFASAERLSQQDVARRLGIDPTLVVGVVDDLQGRDLLRRDRDPLDRRRYVLAVTPQGAAVLAKARKTATTAERDFLAPLDDAQRAQLQTLLVALMTPKLPWLDG